MPATSLEPTQTARFIVVQHKINFNVQLSTPQFILFVLPYRNCPLIG
jgi:hypothetical protein